MSQPQNLHERACWVNAHSSALQNGANSVEAFDWADMWLDPQSGACMEICVCRPGTPEPFPAQDYRWLSRRDFALSRA